MLLKSMPSTFALLQNGGGRQRVTLRQITNYENDVPPRVY